jgi:hypothetical protein
MTVMSIPREDGILAVSTMVGYGSVTFGTSRASGNLEGLSLDGFGFS